MRKTARSEYRSAVYTNRPAYADFDAPHKFMAIRSIIAKRLTEHPKAICSYSGGSDSDILIDLGNGLSRRRDSVEKKILDVTCGARGIWFNKHHPAVVYCDKRKELHEGTFGTDEHPHNLRLDIDPDVVCDFTALPFDDNTFSLVIFDPPHVKGLKETSWLAKEYGVLTDDWREILKGGYKECMRVLKPDGVLVFKWSETQIPANEVWKTFGTKPLFGHHSGKKMNTFWTVFMKIEPKEV